MIDKDAIRQRFLLVSPFLDERHRRLFAASEARAAGRGGIAAVSAITGVARSTIGRGLEELGEGDAAAPGRIRRTGGGRKPRTASDHTLVRDLRRLVSTGTRGDPERALLWSSKSLRKLAAELQAGGHVVSHVLVGELLKAMGYSLQANRKTREGAENADRNAQFEHIDGAVRRCLAAGQPAISVDTKKKELVGDFKNPGRQWRPQGTPEEVRTHDFLIKKLGRAVPYGVYDLADNAGWVHVGTDHDTASFAVNTIRTWWRKLGRARYGHARRLQITADGGGSNGSRVRLWKWELQKLADQTGLDIAVCHFPPGTSKWNKIEHRLFSFISRNWQARPLVSYKVIVELIAATTTTTGLTVHCELDRGDYPKGIAVSDAQMATIRITPDKFHGEWNYTISPRRKNTAIIS
jgi:hypothetical protein